ncbi:MAG TPA: hypothetical protein G4O16_05160 [Dehalococcoidia bacterium]|nr:hypothetical protein [Dehalococcoidia bacterium]
MKSIVIYYSMTGNTKRIAEAIHAGMSQSGYKCEIVSLKEVNIQRLFDYDLIGLGSYVDDFQEPASVTDFIKNMPSLRGKYGFTFCTHGTCPGQYIARMVRSLRRKGLIITGWNDWYGSVFLPFLAQPYYTDGHPDHIDLEEAMNFGKEILERSRRISEGETHLIPRLPRKEKYNKRYGDLSVLDDLNVVPGFESERLTQEDMKVLKPRLNVEKCKYPKCTICVDNCPTQSIHPSQSPPINHDTCRPCSLWFCEQLCPTGAIEVNWEPIIRTEKLRKVLFNWLAEPMKKYKDLRHFRSLISPEEEGRDKPLYKINKHPRIILRDGVARVRK